MKYTSVRWLFCITALLAPLPLFAQGSLTPPGTPAPTMKSLDQVEARTLISSLPYTINKPGSYYLTNNLTATGSGAGITVSADNVTIDLNGFALIGGGSGTVAGIAVPAAQKNLCVRNGTITGWSKTGISASSTPGSLYEKLRLIANNSYGLDAGSCCIIKECLAALNTGTVIEAGIRVLDGSTVVDCTSSGNSSYCGFILNAYCTITNSTANLNGLTGIQAGYGCTISHCSVNNSGSIGISVGNYCTITECTTSANGGTGIQLGSGCTVANCTASKNVIEGIHGNVGCTVRSCTVSMNSGNGISVVGNCHVVGNTCDENNQELNSGEAGIHVTGNDSRIEANAFTYNNNAAILVDSGKSGNVVVGNTFAGAEYIIPSGNTVGPLVETASGSTLSTSSNSLANLHIAN